jgi:hypothetical protein
MVGVPREDRRGAIELLGEHHADQPMRPGGPAEGEAQLGAGEKLVRQTIRAADQEGGAAPPPVAPDAQPLGQLGAAQVAPGRVEGDERRGVAPGAERGRQIPLPLDLDQLAGRGEPREVAPRQRVDGRVAAAADGEDAQAQRRGPGS